MLKRLASYPFCFKIICRLIHLCIQKATVTVQADGLSFNVEVGQTVLARAHLHHQTNFRTYAYNPPEKLLKSKKARNKGQRQRGTSSATEADTDDEMAEGTTGNRNQEDDDDDVPAMTFEISLSALLNCLNIFGDTTVKPITARQQAARDKWKSKQAGNENGGDRPQYGRRSSRYGRGDDEEGEGDDGPQLRDEALFQRDSARGGSTAAPSKKKSNIAMVLSWQEEGCPLVLL